MSRSEDIRKISGLNRMDFCKKYNIPYRTVLNWDKEERLPPDYVFNLLERIVKEDYE